MKPTTRKDLSAENLQIAVIKKTQLRSSLVGSVHLKAL